METIILHPKTKNQILAIKKVAKDFNIPVEQWAKEIANSESKYDEQYLNGLIEKASKNWTNIKDKDLWLQEIRGYEI
jgi:hypothetical protein